MALRIGCDLDGVLADMESELVRQAEALFGDVMTRRLQEPSPGSPPPPEGDAPDGTPEAAGPPEAPPDNVPPLFKLRLTSRQQRRLWHHVETVENFWQGLSEIEPGIVGRLAAIAADRRWEIIFLTKRPESAGATAQVQTQRWLASKGFTLPSVFVVQGSRGRIAASLDLDFVIDDRPENCLDVVMDSKARALLVWRQDPKQLPEAAKRLGIGVVASVDECLDLLTQVDIAGKDQPGVMARVRKLLGLRQPASA
jgi:hypothetical protein